MSLAFRTGTADAGVLLNGIERVTIDNTGITSGIANSSITSSKLTGDAVPIGVGQTWQNFTIPTQRTTGTTYTNSTGKPISVSVRSEAVGALILTVDSIQVEKAHGSASAVALVSAIVPSGSTYSVTGTLTLGVWTELRG